MAHPFNPAQTGFPAGLLSPLMEGRTDIDLYFLSLRQGLNVLIKPQGPLTRRPGSRFGGPTKTESKQATLLNFEVAANQVYVLEIGDQYMRFWVNEGQLDETPGVPEEIATPWLEAEVFDVRAAQNTDVMYLVQGDHWPQKLSRTSLTEFAIADVVFKDGKAPLLPQNLDATHKLVADSATGSVTVTASGAGNEPFLDAAFSVGRHIRMDAAWLRITAWTSTTEVTATVVSGSAPTVADEDWALGAFSDTDGPDDVTFHEGRLVYVKDFRYWLSVSDDFDNFELSDPAAEDAENADKSIAKTLTSGHVNAPRWAVSQQEVLAFGTSGDEFTVRGAGGDILTPTTTVTKVTTERGSAAVHPVVVDGDILFAQTSRQRLIRYSFDVLGDRFKTEILSLFAEPILQGQIRQMVFQAEPDNVVWMVLETGDVVCLTYEASQKVIAMHVHQIGGYFEDGPAVVESVAVIPNPEQTADQVWLIVKRTIDGQTRRYVEYLEDQFRPGLASVHARPTLGPAATREELTRAMDFQYFVDCGLTHDVPVSISGITQAVPAVVTAAGHGFVEDQQVKLYDVRGMRKPANLNPTLGPPEKPWRKDSFVNNKSFVARAVTATTFELYHPDGVTPVDTRQATAYFSGGAVRKKVTAVSGLDHLEGETVAILTDGSPHPFKVVSGGAVMLDNPAAIVHVGEWNECFGETQRFVGGGRKGTDEGRKRRIVKCAFRVYQTLGLRFGQGPKPKQLERIPFRAADAVVGEAPVLFTGDVEAACPGEWSRSPTILFRQDDPLPFTIEGIYPQLEVSEDD